MDELAGLIAIAILPMIITYSYLRAMGGNEQPRANLVRTSLLGMLGMLVSLFVNFPLRFLDVRSSMPLADALLASIVFATLPGEFVKLLTLRYYCQRLRTFSSIPAGMVYGGIAALGFILADAIVFAAPQLWFVSPVRTLAAVPLHAATGAIMGYGLAQEMFTRKSPWTLRKAWVIGVVAHSLFNFSWIYAGLIRSSGGRFWLIVTGLPILGVCVAILVVGWAFTRLSKCREHQLFQISTQTVGDASADATFLQRLRAAAREDDSS
ncbi:PrsW family intramembrane metalloprotease [Candidatus Bipolaricaulota bacterium]|nr:PrsW family intramembrane metalloprotease [Candidatus Bipolaricaulota bacterium]